MYMYNVHLHGHVHVQCTPTCTCIMYIHLHVHVQCIPTCTCIMYIHLHVHVQCTPTCTSTCTFATPMLQCTQQSLHCIIQSSTPKKGPRLQMSLFQGVLDRGVALNIITVEGLLFCYYL